MKRFISILFLLFVFFACKEKDPKCADQVVTYINANIYTLDNNNPRANTMIVKNGIIEFVGNDDAVNMNGEVVDMKGKTILPGFIESHLHPVMATVMNLNFCEVPEDADLNEIRNIIKMAKEKDPNAKQLLFQGYSMNVFDALPSAADIDDIVNDKPVILFDEGFHSAWINTKCMELANINKSTEDPIPNLQYFVRDNNGNPTGYMIDLLPWLMVLKNINLLNEDVLYTGIGDFICKMNSYGYTGLFDAGAAPDPMVQLSAISRLDADNLLKMHYAASYYANPTNDIDFSVNMLQDLDSKFSNNNLHVKTLKLILDGTIEAKSAATLSPLIGESLCAEAFIGKDKFYNLFDLALSKGYNTHVHAIGDKAVSMALDVYTNLNNFNDGVTKTICHNQMYPSGGSDKIKNIKNLFYQTTPVWMLKDDYSLSVLGNERIKRMFPTKSAKENGATITFGSDYPASSFEMLNPIKQIYYAVLRGEANDILFDSEYNEGLSVEEAVSAYTINSAKQIGLGDITGSLEKGKCADFVILNKDIFNVNVQEIPAIQVEATYFKGERVF